MLTAEVLRQVAGPLEGERIEVGRVGDHPIALDVVTDGPEDGEAVLLVVGLGQHRTAWSPLLLDHLHDAGYRTVRADNRDVGRSTVLPGTVLDLPRGPDGWPVPPYSLAEMAADLLGVLDHLDLERAHVVGVSMGGMLAQHLAFSAPDRVATLTSVMSTTGAREVGFPHERAKWVLTALAPAEDRDAYLDYRVALARATGSPGYEDDDLARARAAVAWERGVHPHGSARQLLAIRGDGDRTARLDGVRAPTLVLHGTEDPLIDVSGGRATAAAIPGARLQLLDGMGHDVPAAFHPELDAALLEHLASTTA